MAELDDALNFQLPTGQVAAVAPPPVQQFDPVAAAANFQTADPSGQQVLSEVIAPPIQAFDVPELATPETPALPSPVTDDDFVNPPGAGDPSAAPPSLVDTLFAGELSNVDIANLTGALEPVQGGFGGGAQDSLVNVTQGRAAEAGLGLEQAQLEQQGAFDALAEATRDAAETKAEAQTRTAELSTQKVTELEERTQNAQAVYEVTLKDREMLRDEATLLRKQYAAIQTQPEQTTGQRVLASLAIAFSAMGSAIQRSQGVPAQNLASEIIQQQVDNEFRRQQLELQKVGKEIDFSSNAIAQNSALLKDQVSIERASQLSIIELYTAKAQSILDSSSAQGTRDQAELALAGLKQAQEDKELAWARDDQKFAQQQADGALKAQGTARAAATRARRQQEANRIRVLGQALSADRGERIEARKLEAKMASKKLADARNLARKTALPAGLLSKSNKNINTMLLHLETLDGDPDLTGFGVAEGRVGELLTSVVGTLGGDEFRDKANANRRAANEIARAYRLETTGQQSTDKELERIMRDQGIAPGQPIDVMRISLDNRRSEIGDILVQNMITNPETIDTTRPSGLKLALDSGRLPAAMEDAVMNRLQQHSASGVFQSGGR